MFWLTLIFMGFGLFSPPRNATVVAALFLCALSVSGAIFIILEMDDPLTGVVRISDVPMRKALALLGERLSEPRAVGRKPRGIPASRR